MVSIVEIFNFQMIINTFISFISLLLGFYIGYRFLRLKNQESIGYIRKEAFDLFYKFKFLDKNSTKFKGINISRLGNKTYIILSDETKDKFLKLLTVLLRKMENKDAS